MANIREKIRKLLALAQSPNENEAKSAMLKAKALMAENKLTEFDLGEKSEFKKVEFDDVKWTTDSGEIWMAKLCDFLAENYCCSAAWATARGSRTHTLILAGMENDLGVCAEVIKYAVGYMRNAIKVLERKSRLDKKVVSQSYAEGFLLGLEIAFEEQKEEHPEWGLVVVEPQEVKDYKNTLGTKNVHTRKVEFSPMARMKGMEDGMNFNRTKVIAN